MKMDIYEQALDACLNKCPIIIRGLPGSGKSKFAESLQSELLWSLGFKKGLSFANKCVFVYELDDQFLDEKLNYVFDELRYEYEKTQILKNVIYAFSKGYNVIIPDVFPTVAEITRYGGPLVFTVINQFQNIHNMPSERLQEFKNKWESYPFEIFVKHNPQTRTYEAV